MADYASVQEWALVLASQGIPHEVRLREDDDWTLLVDAPFAERANRALQAYHAENAPPVESVTTAMPTYGRTFVAIAVSVVLIVFFLVTLTGSGLNKWFATGAASSARISNGEWWRTVTALTLHVDLGHVLSNAAAIALLGTALFTLFGPGIGLWLALLAGTFGNLVNALVYGAGHSGVGASTAVFGIVGVLAGAQFARRRWVRRAGSIWLPVIAGLLLFVMLGTGENTDVMAHLWGFVVGIPLGVLAGKVVQRAPRRGVQWALVAAATGAVLLAWWMAASAHPL